MFLCDYIFLVGCFSAGLRCASRLIENIDMTFNISLSRAANTIDHCVHRDLQGQWFAGAEADHSTFGGIRSKAARERDTGAPRGGHRCATPRSLSADRVGGPDQCSLRWNAKNYVAVIAASGLWAELSG